MNNLFERVLEANRRYVCLVNEGSAEQLAALEECRGLMEEVRGRGLCTEYRDYVERRALA